MRKAYLCQYLSAHAIVETENWLTKKKQVKANIAEFFTPKKKNAENAKFSAACSL